MYRICDGDEQCFYDASAMGSLQIGESTKNAHRYFRLLHESMKAGNLLKFIIFNLLSL
jgi:hypothetical protein